MDAQSGQYIHTDDLKDADVSEINRHLGSVMAPIWCAKYGLLPDVSEQDQTFFTPATLNYDFKVYRKDSPLLVSHKKPRIVTDPIKVAYAMRLLDRNPDVAKPWRESVEKDVIKVLDNHSAITGSFKAVSKYYNNNLGIREDEYNQVARQMSQPTSVITNVPDSIMGLIQESYGDVENVTANMITYIFDQLLVDSADQGQFSQLYKDLNENQIYVLHFELTRDGKVSYFIVPPDQPTKSAKTFRREPTDKIRLSLEGLAK